MTLLQLPGVDLSAAADSVSVPDAAKELSMLKTLSFDDLVQKLANDMVQFAIHLALAILVFYIGRFIIRKIFMVVDGILTRRRVDRSLTTFVLSLINMTLYFILIVTIVSILGIETSSFIAIFASAGVAIGMALSGTLQNFAGGVLILLLKPYKIGDYIEAQGYAGKVTEIQIFNTIISTVDNKSIIIPNGGLSTGSINNWSREDYRRVDWTVSISYGDSVESARRAILAMLADDPDVIHSAQIEAIKSGTDIEPSNAESAPVEEEEAPRRSWMSRIFHRSKERAQKRTAALDTSMAGARRLHLSETLAAPVVMVANLGESSVDLTVRAWVPAAKYWPVYFKFNEMFYTELPSAAGVSFPFPQLDVHVNP